MPADSKLTLWGRANSVNVQKVLWCMAELDLAFERIDAGMQFGRNTEADYLAMNPNGRIPTLVDGDLVLWESNAIMRYLCLAYGGTTPLYPSLPCQRVAVERWLDWTLSTVQPIERPLFWGLVRTPPAQRDMIALQKAEECTHDYNTRFHLCRWPHTWLSWPQWHWQDHAPAQDCRTNPIWRYYGLRRGTL